MADLTITPSALLINAGAASRGTALATLTAGMPLYADGTVGSFGPNLGIGDANAGSGKDVVVGVSLHAALAGQPIAYLAPSGTSSVLAFGAILTVNTCYIVSGNAGLIAPIADITAGWKLGVVGFATTTSLMTLTSFNSGVAS